MNLHRRFKWMLLALMAFFAIQVSAGNVNVNQAADIATKFLHHRVSTGALRAPAISNLRLATARKSLVKADATDYYIFNSNSTFIVIAGDDQVPAVLAYGDVDSLNVKNIAPAMKMMLNHYAEQMEALLKGNAVAALSATTTSTTAIAPLITALWDQGSPYYNHTPTQNGQHTYTGCPATSLSMCFYKWKYPATYPAVDAIAASSSGAAASALSAKAADWANMLDSYSGSYTTAQAEAVSWLMRYVGQAEDMQYTTEGSGSYGENVVEACHDFGYTNAEILTYKSITNWYSGSESAANYTDTQWNNILMTELQNGRPMVYLAYDFSSGQASGHAFNVDGCDTSGRYHVNWGWSGVGNGYFTLHNFVASTSATGVGGGSYTFNKGEQVVRYIYPGESSSTPVLTVSPATLSLSATVGETATKTFRVSGSNLSGDISLSLSDASGAFSLSTTSVSASTAASGVDVTVTYNPTAAGTHTATVKLSSTGAESVTVSLTGTATAAALTKYDPVMKSANASYVTSSSFRAEWTDATPSANVSSYTLYLAEKGSTPDSKELADIDLSGTEQVTSWYGYLTNVASKITSYLGSGWTASSSVYANTGMLITKGNFVSPSYDLSGYDKVTVKVKANSYYSSYYGDAKLAVSTGSDSKTQTLTDSETEYTFTLNCSSTDKITIGSASNYIAVEGIKIYAGEAATTAQVATFKVFEAGSAASRNITGIKDKYYTVSGLNAGSTYTYKVKTAYADGTESSWSNEENVTLSTEDTPDTWEKVDPVMASASDVSATSFKASWTHDVDASHVSGYTLYVTKTADGPDDSGDDSQVTLLNEIDGSNYSGSYKSISLRSPWSSSRVYGGNNAVYIGNSYSWWSSTKGYIKYTVPAGYTDATFSVVITSANNSYGTGDVTVKSSSTSAISHDFSKAETYTYVVTASTGDVIQLSTSESRYSPDMASIQIYAGDVTAQTTAKASVSGDASDLVISDIDPSVKSYVVSNLEKGATYSYYVVATYTDGDKATSNTKSVVLAASATMGDLTGINNVESGSAVKSRVFYNTTGQRSLKPWKGVNIVVENLGNGTKKSTKRIMK